MSKHRRGRITVQSQPTGAARGMQRMMGVVHAVFGFVFVTIALTQIIPHAGLIGLPFLAAGAFFCINGIRLAVSKNGMAHRVGYDVETDIQRETIVGIMDEVDNAPSGGDVEERMKQLRSLYDQRLITQEEYEQKRQEILKEL
ncbi:MAG: hypothetical protein E7440_07075 [Ruminococcaceae bacterium]|nr:hypothetical protein [Oscillospiraceae bacterium]